MSCIVSYLELQVLLLYQPPQNYEGNVKTMGAGRGKKEYHEAAALAAKLWINQTNGGVKVVITVIHVEEEIPKELHEYAVAVQNDNVMVIFEASGDMECSQKAQLARMYLFEKDFVKEDDLIMTADADAFVIGDRLISILEEPHDVWIAG